MPKVNNRSKLIRERLFECIHNGEVNNIDLVQIIEHTFSILNLQTLSDYAKNNGISYNGAKYQKNNIILGNMKFIIDNQ